jgi:hypothetical protein
MINEKRPQNVEAQDAMLKVNKLTVEQWKSIANQLKGDSDFLLKNSDERLKIILEMIGVDQEDAAYIMEINKNDYLKSLVLMDNFAWFDKLISES